ncbi:MAG: adenylate/guanylate cyclase domain-containing protein [Cyclobacteriaceae bacterium]|nr:adenylate/guanylate cyclase domain-containing protein [Cyclobacteriaceae bacterium HetDA_MAG_MS6]
MLSLIKKYPKQADVALLVIGFSLGANLFVYLKLAGLNELGIYVPAEVYDINWVAPTFSGLLIGLGFSFLEYRLFPMLSSRLAHLWMSLLRLITFSCCIVGSLVLVHTLADLVVFGQILRSAQETWAFLTGTLFITLYLYLMILGLALNFFRAIGNRFGHGILVNYIVGKYREPVEEDRIFMFIDLDGSTKIAEDLGHTRYSRFLNKCFSDLSILLPDYDAEVYQYVGDEAVVTWNMQQLKDHSKPAFLYLAFERLLERNRSNYEEKFGVFPTFKASINAGKVIVTELGQQRKELAYHGDVLNTASRVLELCSKMKKRLLTTSSLSRAFETNQRLTVQFVSDLVLRGKDHKTEVYEVYPKTASSI